MFDGYLYPKKNVQKKKFILLIKHVKKKTDKERKKFCFDRFQSIIKTRHVPIKNKEDQYKI